jgi:hypothetical protein
MISRNQDGEFIFSVDESDEFEGALKEVLAITEIGKKYRKEYFTKERGDEDAEKLVDAALAVAKDTTGQPLISRPILERALTLLIDSGELQPKNVAQSAQLEEPEEDLRPRGRDGKLLTDSQLKWQEYRTWSETANSSERKIRMNSDSGYATFVRKALQAEMSQPIDGAVPVGPTSKARVSKDLVDFARKYHKEPIANLRPKGGFVTLEGEQIAWPAFNELMTKATAAGVI